jgi:hypothetical protein
MRPLSVQAPHAIELFAVGGISRKEKASTFLNAQNSLPALANSGEFTTNRGEVTVPPFVLPLISSYEGNLSFHPP